MKVSIDSAACMGHGLCYALAPDVFADDPDGYGVVIGDGSVPPEHAGQARKAAGNCPEGAIRVED
jgi:ferredoxin